MKKKPEPIEVVFPFALMGPIIPDFFQ